MSQNQLRETFMEIVGLCNQAPRVGVELVAEYATQLNAIQKVAYAALLEISKADRCPCCWGDSYSELHPVHQHIDVENRLIRFSGVCAACGLNYDTTYHLVFKENDAEPEELAAAIEKRLASIIE